MSYYFKQENLEPVVLDKEEYTTEQWEFLVTLFGRDIEGVERIVLDLKQVEGFVDPSLKLAVNHTNWVKEVATNCGWTLALEHTRNEVVFTFNILSNRGEDFSFTLVDDGADSRWTLANLLYEVMMYCEDFDPEQHAAEWYNVRDKVSGVPKSLEVLLNDAKALEESLQCLVRDLEQGIDAWEDHSDTSPDAPPRLSCF